MVELSGVPLERPIFNSGREQAANDDDDDSNDRLCSLLQTFLENLNF